MTRPSTPLRTARIAAVAIFAPATLVLAGCDQPKPRPAPGQPAAGPAVEPSADPSGTPTPAEWLRPLMGKVVQEAFPETGTCKGNTDIVQKTYAGAPAGVQIHGWGWDLDRKTRIERVVLVNSENRIVGGGQGGAARPDVPAAVPEIQDGATGWTADAAVTAGPLGAYGLASDKAICPLGRIEF